MYDCLRLDKWLLLDCFSRALSVVRHVNHSTSCSDLKTCILYRVVRSRPVKSQMSVSVTDSNSDKPVAGLTE